MLVAKPSEPTFAMATGTTTRRRTRADSLNGDDFAMRSDLTTKRRRDSKGNSVPAAPRTGRSTRSSVGGAKSSSDAYQEADGNFEFSRKSKRVKSSNERPVREEPKAPIKTSVVVEITEDPNRSKRSKPRQSEAVPQTESKSLQAESRPKAPKASTQHGREREKSRMDDAGLPQATAPSPPKERRRVSGTTIVEVPLSETPVIQRNQRMRDKAGGGRRSSFGRRGRRASSLLDSGIIADPHSEVSHRDWYKHIGEDVEPRRMRQLLVWCGRKALKDTPEAKKSKTDRIAQQAAQVIDEELVRVLVDSPEVSNWFSRIASDKPQAPKRPNPRNVDNMKRFEQNVEVLDKLRKEKESWERVLKLGPDSTEIGGSEKAIAPYPVPLERSLPSDLTADMSDTLGPPIPDSRTSLSALLRTTSLSIDVSADSLHRISQFRISTDRSAKDSIKKTLDRLESNYREVQKEEKTDGLNADDILRALSGS